MDPKTLKVIDGDIQAHTVGGITNTIHGEPRQGNGGFAPRRASDIYEKKSRCITLSSTNVTY